MDFKTDEIVSLLKEQLKVILDSASAHLKCASGMYHLGYYLHNGIGIEKNKKEAVK